MNFFAVRRAGAWLHDGAHPAVSTSSFAAEQFACGSGRRGAIQSTRSDARGNAISGVTSRCSYLAAQPGSINGSPILQRHSSSPAFPFLYPTPRYAVEHTFQRQLQPFGRAYLQSRMETAASASRKGKELSALCAASYNAGCPGVLARARPRIITASLIPALLIDWLFQCPPGPWPDTFLDKSQISN